MLYLLRITKTDPTTESFKEAFQMAETNGGGNPSGSGQKRGSSMSVVLFLGFILSAPYLLMKLFGGAETPDQSKNPREWKNPVEAVAIYNFDGANPGELTIRAGQPILIAPRTVQTEQNLLNTGWVLASVDNTTAGLIPVNYVQGAAAKVAQKDVTLHSEEQQQQPQSSDA